ncbi:sugar phosphate isomerase/epimerase family protein [Candidatus Omnitrophota bacterium]
MRLCLNDSRLGPPYGKLPEERLKVIHDIGFRVAGIGIDIDATDDDIKRVQRMFADYGMAFGPGSGGSFFNPDPSVRRTRTDRVKKVLEVAGRLGCPTIRAAGGSMNPANHWIHHPENHMQKAFDLYVENTRELLPYAEAAKVAICPETTQWTIINGTKRMKEYVDRLDSDYVKVIFDFVNHMTYDRVYDSGGFARRVVAELGDRIGVFHVKDVKIGDQLLVCHIDEAPLGTGILDHEAVIGVSKRLEPWKTFSLEHFNEKDVPKEVQWKKGYDCIQGIADRIGHTWTNPLCTREKWESGECK